MPRFLGPAVRFVTAKPGRCQTCERHRQPAVTQISVFSVARLNFPAPTRRVHPAARRAAGLGGTSSPTAVREEPETGMAEEAAATNPG